MAIRGYAAAAAVVVSLTAAPAHAQGRGSLYSGPGPRPGPDILYSRPATSPQLQNRGIWHAQPILVSGGEAYRNGEYLYQDYLYDDHGAWGGRDASDPRLGGFTFSDSSGTYLYPSERAYANNAADIVEFRAKPLATTTAFRITLNSMTDPGLVATTIAIGNSAEPREFPDGANVSAPAELFLTVHGDSAELVDAADGSPVGPAPSVSTSVRRRQIEIRIPHSAWKPGNDSVRFAFGTGLWDNSQSRYLTPGATRSRTEAGGAALLGKPPAFFNVGFRFDEPFQVPDQSSLLKPAWWRDRQQAGELASGDISSFHAEIDFGKLADAVTDNSAVPKRGALDRILVSHFEVSQGVDYGTTCMLASDDCAGPFQGRLEPYAIYVPRRHVPKRGFGMTLLLHSLGANYNQFSTSDNQSQFAKRGKGSIIVTPESHGPDGSYDSYAGVEVFEVWADVARRYRLDPGFTSIAGYSMGGFGTFKLAEQFPDLFARAQPTVGAEGTTYREASLRNIPVLMWNGAADELVGPELYLPTANALDELGYDYELDVYAPGEHLSLAINDQFQPAADFLGTARVNRNPFHVTYVVDPELDEPLMSLVADHAYWLSGLVTANLRAHGAIDALSRGFGEADPPVSATSRGLGTLPGGKLLNPYPFTSSSRSVGAPPPAPPADAITIASSNVKSATINVARAGVDCDVKLRVATDVPIAIRLAGCDRVVRAG